MTPVTQRLFALLGLFIIGLGSVYILPSSPERPDPGVVMDLPLFVGDWVGRDAPVSQKERDVLGHDTQFARKSYTNMTGDEMYVSIVLAGEDMNTSIHRPERCLPAQGYTMMESSRHKIDLPEAVTVTRLHNKRPLALRNGKQVMEYSINYYWFIGATETTPDHVERNLIDVRDRLLQGYNQPWAFVSVICRVTDGLMPLGKSEEETEKLLNNFMKELIPVIQKSTVLRR